MKTAYHFFIAASVLLFLLHQLSQKVMGWSLPLVDNYLDCLLCTPLLLAGRQWEQRRLWGVLRLSGGHTAVATLLLMLVSELLFPRLSPAFTADPWDAVMIGAGGLLFWWFNQLSTANGRLVRVFP